MSEDRELNKPNTSWAIGNLDNPVRPNSSAATAVMV
jgi:hypothetical protein